MKNLTTILLFLFAALPALGQWSTFAEKDEWGEETEELNARSDVGELANFRPPYDDMATFLLVDCWPGHGDWLNSSNIHLGIWFESSPNLAWDDNSRWDVKVRMLPSRKVFWLKGIQHNRASPLLWLAPKGDAPRKDVLLELLQAEESITFVLPWYDGDTRVKFGLAGSDVAIDDACPELAQ